MGIKNLSKLITKEAPDAISSVSMESLNGLTIAIDTPIFMYKFCHTSMGNPIPLLSLANARHPKGGRDPIYVVDGRSSSAKKEELEKRRLQKQKNREELEMLKQSKHIDYQSLKRRRSLERRILSIPTSQHYQDIQRLAIEENIEFIVAAGDAEKQCVNLVRSQKADIVATEDLDTLVYFAGRHLHGKMIRNFMAPGMCIYDMKIILEKFQLTFDSFIDMCILSGCDFSEKIRGIAVFKAYKLIREHHSIEEVLAHLDREKFIVPDNFRYPVARMEFKFYAASGNNNATPATRIVMMIISLDHDVADRYE